LHAEASRAQLGVLQQFGAVKGRNMYLRTGRAVGMNSSSKAHVGPLAGASGRESGHLAPSGSAERWRYIASVLNGC